MPDWTRFDRTAETLALQGFNVIPLPEGAKGAGGSGITFRHLNKPDSRRVTRDDRQQWRRKFSQKGFEGTVGAYILPASGQHFAYAIVDIDDPEFDQQALETFGESPLFVSRSGRVRHRYYRTSDPRRAHALGIWGKRTVDVISTTGVVLPASVHQDGNAYELSIPLERWTRDWVEENVPELDVSILDELRQNRRRSTKAELAEPIRGNAAGFLHARDPIDFGDSMWCGHILPSTIIHTVEGPIPMARVPHGTKCYSTYRDDRHPSSHVSEYRGRRYFWDMSTEPKRYWTMIEELSGKNDPELTDQTAPSLERALIDRLGVEVEVVDDHGYLADQIPEIEDDTTVFLVAPHGTGKTVLARREHDRARTSVSVCNTQALTIANASVLGLKPVYEGIDTEPKGSACIPSLARYEMPPEFFHVDEADAVHGFLHSGKVDEPLEAWRTLAYFAALSRRCLIASADLGFEDIALFVHAIRERNATRRLKVVIRPPTETRAKLLIRPVGFVKEQLHDHLQVRHDGATFVGITTRKLAGQIAQGYRVAGSSDVIDLDEVATITNVIDSPKPYPLKDVEIDQTAEVDAPFFVSGENNRYFEAVRWLEDTTKLVDEHDLIVTSPAVQSGVSLDGPISRVFLLHENREVPADAVIQIARRARHPTDKEILVGVRRWQPQPHRTDRAYLDDLQERRAKTTIRAIVDSFPALKDDHEVEKDAEFAWSWRITMRKLIRSYADPLAALESAAIRHGWEVDTELEVESDPSSFQAVTRAARAVRTTLNAEQTSQAPDIDQTEKDRLERSPELQDGERQALDKADIAEFYGCKVDPELVVRDDHGRYRGKVRAYTHASLIAAGRPEIVAYLDHTRAKGRQPSEMAHAYARAVLMVDLWNKTILDEFGTDLEFSVHDVRDRIWTWWTANRPVAQTFFPRLRGPTKGWEVRWLCDRFRALGAEIKTKGKSDKRRKVVDWTTVDELATRYGEKLFELHEKSESEEWSKEWSKTKTS